MLCRKLEDINGEIEKLPGKSQLKLFLTAFKTKERLVDIRNKLHVAVDRFEVCFVMIVSSLEVYHNMAARTRPLYPGEHHPHRVDRCQHRVDCRQHRARRN